MIWSKKGTSKVKNTLLQWILQKITEKQTLQRITKFITVDSYEIDFMKCNFVLVKLDKMYNILKSTSPCLFVER